MKRFTPAARAVSASRTEPWWLISMVRPGIVLADRVVGELGEVHHRVEAAQVLGPDPAQVLGDHLGMGLAVVEQPAAAVEAGVEADDVVARLQELRAHDHADIAVGSGQKNFHACSQPALGKGRGRRRTVARAPHAGRDHSTAVSPGVRDVAAA